MKRHLNIRIFGLVQGVFFRDSARGKAEELGIKGFVRNERDDSVYLEVEGEEKAVEQFLAWCRKGPTLASVKRVEAEEGTLKDFREFLVLRYNDPTETFTTT
jgi:acylphosphatase